jgi:predicted transposase YbfD/YdcC
MVVKGNQPALLDEIQTHFERVRTRAAELEQAKTPAFCLKSQRVRVVGDDGPGLSIGSSRTHEKGHGRIETRALQVLKVPRSMDWPAAAQIIRLERRTLQRKSGLERTEIVYAITSLRPEEASPDQLQQVWRGHWAIENRSHWVRDVVFDEDRSTVRTGSIPQVMAALRNTMIGLLRLFKYPNIKATLRSFSYDARKVLPVMLMKPTFE